VRWKNAVDLLHIDLDKMGRAKTLVAA